MSLPPSVVRFNRDGIQYTSSVDRCQYTIKELTRAALRDVGKMLARKANQMAQKTLKGMKKNKRVRGRTSTFGYWARKIECDLQFGAKVGTWYSTEQELGSSKMPKLAIMHTVTMDSIADIVEIESKYLSGLEDEAEALRLIESEDDYVGGEDD